MHYDIWRMEAMNELREYNARKQAIKNIPGKIAELEAAITAIRGGAADDIPVQSSGSGRENALLNNIVSRQKLEKSLQETEAAVTRVEGALNALTKEDRRILECFFIIPRQGAVSQLASELLIEEKTVYNRRNDALYRFMKAMYGDIA